MGHPAGRKFSDVYGTKLVTLIDYGYAVGDLVSLSAHGLNSGGVVYRITRDNPPAIDSTWGTFIEMRYMFGGGPQRTKKPLSRQGWIDKNNKVVRDLYLYGCITLEPVFSFFPYKGKSTKKSVPYRQIEKRLKKVGLVELGITFTNYQEFINNELKRLSGE